MKRKRLVLAYLVVGCGALALVGQLGGSERATAIGAGLAVMLALVHAIAFFVRVRKRRLPALLDAHGRRILACALAAVIGVLLANFTFIAIHVDGKVTSAESGTSFGWLVVMLVVAVRAWLVRSARRAGVLYLVAVWLGIPQILGMLLSSLRAGFADKAVVDTLLLVSFVVIVAAGAVLDRLYADVADRDPGPLPEAIVHQ